MPKNVKNPAENNNRTVNIFIGIPPCHIDYFIMFLMKENEPSGALFLK